MKKLSAAITNSLIQKGTIKESSYSIYQYGIQTLFEIILNITASLIIAIYFGMILECILFFLIFIPLRSYAGGFHFHKHLSCFICSCAVLIALLSLVKFTYLSQANIGVIYIVSLVLIKALNVTIDINRPLEQEEKQYFNKKLNRILLFITLAEALLFFTNSVNLASVIAFTMLTMVLVLIIGKLKYKLDLYIELTTKINQTR